MNETIKERASWDKVAREAWEEEQEQPKNTSGLRPLGFAVLVEPFEPEFKKSIIQIPITVRMRTQMAETRAVIIEIGPEAWSDEKEPRAKVGDRVIITRFAGTMLTGPNDDKIYRMVNDKAIFCGIDSNAWPTTEQLEETVNER